MGIGGRDHYVYGQTEIEVSQKLLDLRAKLQVPGVVASEMALGTAIDFWLSGLKPSVEWFTGYRIELVVRDHIKPFLGAVKLHQLTPFLIADWYSRMTSSGVTVASQKRAGQVLRQALGQAVRFKMVGENVAKLIPLPKVRKREINPLTPDQIHHFLEVAVTDRWYSLYVLALDSGARQGELLALNWSDLVGRELSITKNLAEVGPRKWEVKDTKTRSGKRRIVLAPSTVTILEPRRTEGHRPIFETRGKRWLTRQNLYQYSFRPLLRRSGLDFHFHDLRHTCASLLLSAGVNLKVVSERLGHADPSITLNTYCHVLPGDQEKAAKTLESILWPLGASRIDSEAGVLPTPYPGCPD